MKTKTIENFKHTDGKSYTVVVDTEAKNFIGYVYDHFHNQIIQVRENSTSIVEKYCYQIICCTPPIEGIDGMRELKIAKPNIIDWRRIERDFYQYRKSLVTVYGEEPITTPSALFFFLEHNELSPFAHKAELKIQEEKLAEKRAKDICKNNTYLLDEPEVQEIIKAWQKDIDKKANTSGGKWSDEDMRAMWQFVAKQTFELKKGVSNEVLSFEEYLQSLSHWEYIVEMESVCWCMKPISGGCEECTIRPKIIIENGRRIVEGKWKQVKG